MLTSLKFKNWRSLRDVEINNLTPITVFVGANSSGKTNILDGLHFMRYAENVGVTEATYVWRVAEKVRTLRADKDQATEVEISYLPKNESSAISYNIELRFLNNTIFSLDKYWNSLWDTVQGEQISQFIALRWQLLRENFMPPTAIPSDTNPSNLYIIDPLAQNVPFMLDFMRQGHPEIYNKLQADLEWLLGHLDTLKTIRDDRETRIIVTEKPLQGQEAPTISAGTARIIAILTAYYALDMRDSNLPGLVVVEEPDMAVHPLLLRNFVELLRTYAEDEEHPRQFILTTHNPMFLNLFKPEEVRIVERDEDGFTTVNEVNKDVANVWYEKYGDYSLGQIWTTRLLGGVPR